MMADRFPDSSSRLASIRRRLRYELSPAMNPYATTANWSLQPWSTPAPSLFGALPQLSLVPESLGEVLKFTFSPISPSSETSLLDCVVLGPQQRVYFRVNTEGAEQRTIVRNHRLEDVVVVNWTNQPSVIVRTPSASPSNTRSAGQTQLVVPETKTAEWLLLSGSSRMMQVRGCTFCWIEGDGALQVGCLLRPRNH
uniref:Uncharacterized protein n=1 Tax=Mycena chlorophos TaxID=658473 RepID=A0ABQ0M7G5_MYCCL|nr:predicted protein [Mycena chlorophos]